MQSPCFLRIVIVDDQPFGYDFFLKSIAGLCDDFGLGIESFYFDESAHSRFVAVAQNDREAPSHYDLDLSELGNPQIPLVSIQALLVDSYGLHSRFLKEEISLDEYLDEFLWRSVQRESPVPLLFICDLDLRNPEGARTQRDTNATDADRNLYDNADGFIFCMKVKEALGSGCSCYAVTGASSVSPGVTRSIMQFLKLADLPCADDVYVKGTGVNAWSSGNDQVSEIFLRKFQQGRRQFLAEHMWDTFSIMDRIYSITIDDGLDDFLKKPVYKENGEVILGKDFLPELCLIQKIDTGRKRRLMKRLFQIDLLSQSAKQVLEIVKSQILQTFPVDLSLSFSKAFSTGGMKVLTHPFPPDGLLSLPSNKERQDAFWRATEHAIECIDSLRREIETIRLDGFKENFYTSLRQYFNTVLTKRGSLPIKENIHVLDYIKERIKKHELRDLERKDVSLVLEPELRKTLGDTISEHLDTIAGRVVDRVFATDGGTPHGWMPEKSIDKGKDFLHWPWTYVFLQALENLLAWSRRSTHPPVTHIACKSIPDISEQDEGYDHGFSCIAFCFGGQPAFDVKTFIEKDNERDVDFIGDFLTAGLDYFGRLYLCDRNQGKISPYRLSREEKGHYSFIPVKVGNIGRDARAIEVLDSALPDAPAFIFIFNVMDQVTEYAINQWC